MMRHEMVRTLLHKAAQDVAVVTRLLDDREIDDEVIGFHAQQAVEKSLKAWLSFLSVDYPKTHSLETLLGLLKAQGQSLPDGLDDVSALTPFATTFRYDDLPFTTSFSREDALNLAQQVLAFVESKVTGDT